MGIFGAIPAAVSDAVAAGCEAVAVEIGGTLMSFVPDTISDAPQVWWTRLGVWIECQGLVTSKHASSQRIDGRKLPRLRFAEYLPGAKVLVWQTSWTVFIYVKQGLSKQEAALAVRAALKAAGRPKLNPAHAAIVGIGAAGGLHLPAWVPHWPLQKGAVAAAGGSFALASVFFVHGIVSHTPQHQPPTVAGPVAADPPATPFFEPKPHQPTVRPANQPSTWVQADPTLTPVQVPTPPRTVPASPSPTPSVPAPEPSSETTDPGPVPTQPTYPWPSGVATDSPSPWWQPTVIPTAWH